MRSTEGGEMRNSVVPAIFAQSRNIVWMQLNSHLYTRWTTKKYLAIFYGEMRHHWPTSGKLKPKWQRKRHSFEKRKWFILVLRILFSPCAFLALGEHHCTFGSDIRAVKETTVSVIMIFVSFRIIRKVRDLNYSARSRRACRMI